MTHIITMAAVIENHGGIPIVHSQCESRKTRTFPVATDAPRSRARINPSRFLFRITRTFSSLATYSSNGALRWSKQEQLTITFKTVVHFWIKSRVHNQLDLLSHIGTVHRNSVKLHGKCYMRNNTLLQLSNDLWKRLLIYSVLFETYVKYLQK